MRDLVKAMLGDIMLFFAPYVTSVLRFVYNIEHSFHAKSFKYSDEVLLLVTDGKPHSSSNIHTPLKLKATADSSLLLSKLVTRAGFYPYNICQRKPGEDLSSYKKRVCHYRLGKLAEKIIENKDLLERFCAIRPVFRERALFLADSLSGNRMIRMAGSILLNQKSFDKLTAILCDKDVINTLADAIVELDEACKECHRLKKSSTNRMKDAVINFLVLGSYRVESLLPIAIECIENINELVLDCIHYRNYSGNIAPIRKDQWYNLLHIVKDMCTELVGTIQSFRDNFDDGRIYGDWLIKMTSVVNNITSLLENFSQYLPASSFISIDGSTKSILLNFTNITSVDALFNEIDNILPKVNNEQGISLHREGGIMRMVQMAFSLIIRELPFIADYLAQSLHESHEKYVAVHGEQQEECISKLDDSVKITRFFSNIGQMKNDIYNSINNIIYWIGCYNALSEQSYEALQNSISGYLLSCNNAPIIKGITSYFASDTSMMMQLLKNSIVSTDITTKELYTLMGRLQNIFHDIESCDDSDAVSASIMCTAQGVFCDIMDSISEHVRNRFLSDCNDFLNKASNCYDLTGKLRGIYKEIVAELDLLERYSKLSMSNTVVVEKSFSKQNCSNIEAGA
ncbi:hypothetical protein [Candidatus Xenohaliotis californiensis]